MEENNLLPTAGGPEIFPAVKLGIERLLSHCLVGLRYGCEPLGVGCIVFTISQLSDY
jgi:hypothetical protein